MFPESVTHFGHSVVKPKDLNKLKYNEHLLEHLRVTLHAS